MCEKEAIIRVLIEILLGSKNTDNEVIDVFTADSYRMFTVPKISRQH